MSKEEVISTLGKPYKTSARYDEQENIIDILFYKEKTQDIWNGITTINNHIFVFKNKKLIAIDQGDEQSFKETYNVTYQYY